MSVWAGLLLLCASLLLGCGSSPTPVAPTPQPPSTPTPVSTPTPTPTAPSPTPTAACGVERWAVKTLTDPDASRVDVADVNATTVASLNAFPMHCSDLPDNR